MPRLNISNVSCVFLEAYLLFCENKNALNWFHGLPRNSFNFNDHIFSSNPTHLDNLIDMTSREPSRTSQSSNQADPEADEVYVDCMGYNTVISVTDSDHKPVWSLLKVTYPTFVQQKRRQTCFAMLRNVASPSQAQVKCQLRFRLFSLHRNHIGVICTIFTWENCSS